MGYFGADSCFAFLVVGLAELFFFGLRRCSDERRGIRGEGGVGGQVVCFCLRGRTQNISKENEGNWLNLQDWRKKKEDLD